MIKITMYLKKLKIINNGRKYFLLFILIIVILNNFIGYFFPMSKIVSSSTISSDSIRFYWNEECTDEVDSINWGVLFPGVTKTITVFLKNEGINCVITSNYFFKHFRLGPIPSFRIYEFELEF